VFVGNGTNDYRRSHHIDADFHIEQIGGRQSQDLGI